jgi:hypothetical protein
MPTQDPNPLPYGALPYYQVHYIVGSLRIPDPDLITARCVPIKKGSIANKRVTELQWMGGRLAELLKKDKDLSDMLLPLMQEEGEINIDPQEDKVRIYTKWKREDKIGFDMKFFKVAERIATIIRQIIIT